MMRCENADDKPLMCCTDSDVLVVLSQLVGSGHHLPLSDPLLQVVHLSVELEETETLVQLPPTLLRQILQPGVQLVHLRLTHADTLAAGRGGERFLSVFFLFF